MVTQGNGKIYTRGNKSLLEYGPPKIAVIGKRETTDARLQAAYSIGRFLASEGYAVVNGLARGCDTAALEGALSGGGKTIAVLPCGLDAIYPYKNRGLATRIAESGGLLVSEYPEGTKPEKHRFLERDRLIVEYADAVCVVDIGTSGGTAYTADYAKTKGKRVLYLLGTDPETSFSGKKELLAKINS